MANKTKSLVISDLSGGRNGFDPPTQLPDDQCVEALNIDWWDGGVGNKRGGATALSMTFSAGGPFVGPIGSLIRHVPGNDESVAELWAFERSGSQIVGRLAGGTTWTAPTLTDAVDAGTGHQAVGASLNGMLYLGYDSGTNRLHVWDPSLSKVRRVGFATPATPSVAAMGAGALSFTRFYRARWVDISGSDTRRRSEASGNTSITIAAKLGATVTRPALAGEDETHWEVEYADAAAGPWYRAAQVAAATTTYDDTAASVSTTNLSATVGINTAPPSARYVLSDDNRLVMAGCFETSGGSVTPKNTRVWWTPVLGSTDIGDSERIVFNSTLGNGYLDVEAAITGLGGPLQGAIYVFAYRRIWKLVLTGLASAPYQRFGISNGIGCVANKSIIQAEDENGNPALYFLSHRGPYRLGAFGLQYLGTDIEDLWSTVNLAAGTIVAHGVYHADKHQVWWWVATSTEYPSTLKLVFDTRLGRTVSADAVRKGWSRHNGETASAECSVLFSTTVGASMARTLKPYIGQTPLGNRIWQCDASATDDAGTNFQAYVDTKEYGAIGQNHSVREGVLIAPVKSGVTVTVAVRSDFGLDGTPSGSALLTAAGSETRVQKRLEGMQTAGVGTFSLRAGDTAAANNQWTIDAISVNVTEQEPRS